MMAFLCIVPFTHQLRYSIKKTVTLCAFIVFSLMVVITATTYLFDLSGIILSAIFAALCFGLYFIVVRAHWLKMLFIFLSGVGLASFTCLLGFFVEAYYFPQANYIKYRA